MMLMMMMMITPIYNWWLANRLYRVL